MLSAEIKSNNEASWAELLVNIEQDPDSDTWREWKRFMRDLLQAGVGAGLSQYFRAGRAMHDIIFSACERHGLERNGAYVYLARAKGEYFVAGKRFCCSSYLSGSALAPASLPSTPALTCACSHEQLMYCSVSTVWLEAGYYFWP
jgi:hypothetical protein